MLSIVIATYCRYPILLECVSQLLRVETYGISDELIIVDNSANPDRDVVGKIQDICRLKIILKYFSFPGRYRNDLNALRNIGFRKSRGDVIIFLDDDAFILTKGWGSIIESLLDDRTLAGITGNLLEPGKRIVDWDGRAPFGKITDKGQIIGHFFYKPAKETDIDHMRGCFMVLRRTALDSVGIFDEQMKGLYLDETELCVRLQRFGYRLILTPEILVDHRMAPRGQLATRSIKNSKTVYTRVRNTYYLFLKHYFGDIKMAWGYLVEFYHEKLSQLFRTGDPSIFVQTIIFPIAVMGGVFNYLRYRISRHA